MKRSNILERGAMADWDEQDFRPDDEEDAYREVPEEILVPDTPSHTSSSSPYLAWSIWAAAALVVVLASVFIYQRTRPMEPSPELEPIAEAALPGDAPRAPEPEPDAPPLAPLPPLGESDVLVRELLAALSAHPALAAFLVDEDLVRRAVVIVVNVAEGDDPGRHVRHLAPEEKFAVVRRGARLYVDRASYRRYDALAAGFASLDAEGTAELYRRVKPLVEEAYRELGYLDQPFEDMLARAMRNLAEVPVIDGSVEVHPVSVNYQYTDSRLAGLQPAQKLLLRMGADNVKTIHTKLRELAVAFALTL